MRRPPCGAPVPATSSPTWRSCPACWPRPDLLPAVKAASVTPVAFVRMLLMAYAKYGVDPTAALARAQIGPDTLRRREATVTSWQLQVLAGEAMRELDDEALGWFSRRLPWGSYVMLLRASLTSPNLGIALRRWVRHHNLLTDDIVLSLHEAGDVATVALVERRLDPAMREFCLVTLLRNIHGISCWLVDSGIALEAVAFPFKAPAHAAVYPVLFPGPVHFGALHAALSFDSRYLALPLRRDDQALRALLPQALSLVVRPYRRDRLLVQRVRMLLQDQPGAGTADALAHALNMSPRTLHRQLQQEGASLQDLKDEVRREQAMALLRRTARPVKQVAQAVGFTSEKSFARAFRQWTGESPAEYRRKGLAV
ncbi:MAG: AraC family transcriptional regulator [Ramlibacter sp.]|nr:AraC family transcriptional regulator [Ramlibacter sp.]MCW5650118.1 AraC family transcriptional regulator [Ramlibacter sp.]